MTTLFLLLDTIIYFLETVKTYELKRKKDKGHVATTTQPLNINTYSTGN